MRGSGVSGCSAAPAGAGLAQPEAGPLSVIDELDLDVVETAGDAMLDGHEGLPVAASQVEIGIPQACGSEPPRGACPGRVAPLLRARWTKRAAVSK